MYRISPEIGSLAAALGGLNAVVFTGGIGENAAEIRARVCRDMTWLGLELDEIANAAADRRINTSSSGVAAWVVRTDEEAVVAAHARRLVRTAAATSRNR